MSSYKKYELIKPVRKVIERSCFHIVLKSPPQKALRSMWESQ